MTEKAVIPLLNQTQKEAAVVKCLGTGVSLSHRLYPVPCPLWMDLINRPQGAGTQTTASLRRGLCHGCGGCRIVAECEQAFANFGEQVCQEADDSQNRHCGICFAGTSVPRRLYAKCIDVDPRFFLEQLG